MESYPLVLRSVTFFEQSLYGDNQVNMRRWRWALVWRDWCPYKEFDSRGVHTMGRRHVKTKATSRWCSHKPRDVENYHTPPASRGEAWDRFWVTGLRENHACQCLHPVLPASRPVLYLYHHFKQHTASSTDEALNKCLENDWVQNPWPYYSFCTQES